MFWLRGVPASFLLCAGAAQDATAGSDFRVTYRKRKRKGTPKSQHDPGFRLRIGSPFASHQGVVRTRECRGEKPIDPVVHACASKVVGGVVTHTAFWEL